MFHRTDWLCFGMTVLFMVAFFWKADISLPTLMLTHTQSKNITETKQLAPDHKPLLETKPTLEPLELQSLLNAAGSDTPSVDKQPSTPTALRGPRAGAECVFRKADADICSVVSERMKRDKLKRIFVGASAKCAGSHIKTFFSTKEKRPDASWCERWAITGGHLYGGSKKYLKAPCASQTLFVFTVREQRSWLESAMRHVCVMRRPASRFGRKHPKSVTNCGVSEKDLARVVRNRKAELSSGPSDWMKKSDFKLNNVLALDYRAIDMLLSCFPRGGDRTTSRPMLSPAEVYIRRPVPEYHKGRSSNDRYRVASGHMVKVWDAVSKPFWLNPHVSWMLNNSCLLASFSRFVANR